MLAWMHPIVLQTWQCCSLAAARTAKSPSALTHLTMITVPGMSSSLLHTQQQLRQQQRQHPCLLPSHLQICLQSAS